MDRTQILREMRRERGRLGRRTLRRSVLAVFILAMLFGFITFQMRFMLVRVDGPGMGWTIPSGSVVLIRRVAGEKAEKKDIVLVRLSDEYLLRRIAYVAGETIGADDIKEEETDTEGTLHVSVFGDAGRSLTTKELNPLPEPEIVPDHSVYLITDTSDMGINSRSLGCVDTADILGIYVDTVWPPMLASELKEDVHRIFTDW
ncbi:MAG: signal peptidase I [Clostridia bacterium]|nr:signal peptidase I [Clostridia bacterium]